MKKFLTLILLIMLAGSSAFAQSRRTAFIQVDDKNQQFGFATTDDAVVVLQDSCAIYQLTATRASDDSMNTAFRKGEYCVVAGGSSQYQNLSWDAASGHIDLSNGTNADVGLFGTANTNYGFVQGSNGNTTYFLRGDGTWVNITNNLTDGYGINNFTYDGTSTASVVADTGTMYSDIRTWLNGLTYFNTDTDEQDLTWDGTNGHIEISNGNDADVGMFSTVGTTYGFVPGSNGNTTYFLQGDGSWADLSGTYDNYDYWTISDSEGTPNSENISSTDQVTFAASGLASVLYSTASNTLTVGASAANLTDGDGLADFTYDGSSAVGIDLGTPSTLSSSSTNAVTATSHTHAVSSGDLSSTTTNQITVSGTGKTLDDNLSVAAVTGAVTDAGTALATGDQIYDFVVGQGYLTGNESITLSGDVTGSGATAITTTIANNAVESGMLNDNVISGQTALTSGLASTDEMMVSDAGSLKRMDVSVLETYMQNNLTFTTNTDDYVTGVSFNTGTGVLTLTRNTGGDLTEDLDGRYHEDGDPAVQSESFTATASQTQFEVTGFDLTDDYLVFVNGALNMGGHSRSTNTVTFETGLTANTEVVIVN